MKSITACDSIKCSMYSRPFAHKFAFFRRSTIVRIDEGRKFIGSACPGLILVDKVADHSPAVGQSISQVLAMGSTSSRDFAISIIRKKKKNS